eukprot:TRINITY_DN21163_c0_g2_i1.p1 TRINITY_DN21163_c0_g2~~TRINITY_DN21163_c0_g2_i1.p1  ORF type:complete len:180 (+),score=39.37 TRINITY_DN21163_c0_g2_i1:155-694(+)
MPLKPIGAFNDHAHLDVPTCSSLHEASPRTLESLGPLLDRINTAEDIADACSSSYIVLMGASDAQKSFAFYKFGQVGVKFANMYVASDAATARQRILDLSPRLRLQGLKLLVLNCKLNSVSAKDVDACNDLMQALTKDMEAGDLSELPFVNWSVPQSMDLEAAVGILMEAREWYEQTHT